MVKGQMKKRKKKLPIFQTQQLIMVYHAIESGPLQRHITLARLRSVLKWGGSNWERKKRHSIV